MSSWTHVLGTIKVSPAGRTQAEKRYILETILNHLPVVTGSEEDMSVNIIESHGCNGSSSDDEYGDTTNNLTDSTGRRSRKHGWLRTHEEYLIVIEGNLRDRQFDETFRELQKWLCRLAKRVYVYDMLVTVRSYDRQTVIKDWQKYHDMFERPSWSSITREPAWWEHLMWDRFGNTNLPLSLIVKYYNNDAADKAWDEKYAQRQ